MWGLSQLILDRISKGINEKVKRSGLFRQAIFNFAYEYKLKWTKRGYDTPIFDKLIFGAAKQVLGGRVRLILSGGAPLSPETHMQVKLCLCVTVTQGYGLTETCSCATVMDRKSRPLHCIIIPILVICCRGLGGEGEWGEWAE
jgi:long-chain acyl-CoA synthetase